jgi:conjugal transfer pilus assembly protein TrbC
MLWTIIINSSPIFAWSTNAPVANVLVFISFSMPKNSLRGWIKQADKIQAPVIIRGLHHNSFRDTTKAVIEMIPDNHGGVQLDPTLFKRFHIEKVPAVVVIDSECLSDQQCNVFHVVYGDVTLDYALKEIAKQQDSLSLYAEAALQQLKARRT